MIQVPLCTLACLATTLDTTFVLHGCVNAEESTAITYVEHNLVTMVSDTCHVSSRRCTRQVTKLLTLDLKPAYRRIRRMPNDCSARLEVPFSGRSHQSCALGCRCFVTRVNDGFVSNDTVPGQTNAKQTWIPRRSPSSGPWARDGSSLGWNTRRAPVV